jgi:hypothetical protein
MKRVQIWHDGIATELEDNEEARQCSVCGKYHVFWVV